MSTHVFLVVQNSSILSSLDMSGMGLGVQEPGRVQDRDDARAWEDPQAWDGE